MRLSCGRLRHMFIWLVAGTVMPFVPASAAPKVDAAKAAAVHPDFSGVWKLADPARVVMPETNGTLTPEAKANLEHFRKYYKGEDADPAVKVCLAKGMPWTSLIRARDYPVDIYQTKDRVIMTFELYDMYRTIFIDGPPKPDYYPDGPNGYSVGHWEGDTLVIETTGIMPLNPIGPNLRGSDTKIVERWTMKKDPEFGDLIVIDLDQYDPETYVGPAHGHNELARSPAGTVVGGYGCSASLWDAFVEKKEAEISAGQEKESEPR